MKASLPCIVLACLAASPLHASDAKPGDTSPAANALNALGIDLLVKTTPGKNALLSPYSISSALAMAYAGASGKTRDEMAATLHFPNDASVIPASFAKLRKQLEDEQADVTQRLSSKGNIGRDQSGYGAETKSQPEPALILSVANRLYAQSGFAFRKPFLDVVKNNYDAPLQELDFATTPFRSSKTINDWVSERTNAHIKDLIPIGAITQDTRLVLVNAIYFKGVWDKKFDISDTKPGAFHIDGGDARDVPMMYQEYHLCDYMKRDGYTAVAISYIGSIRFVILLPDDPKGLPALEAKLTPALLAGLPNSGEDMRRVKLWLPKFKLDPPAMELGNTLKALGMKTAFDDPKGSADFDGVAPRTKEDYLYLSAVYHKTSLSLDETGTEAAGATAVLMFHGALIPDEEPAEIHVDHPFLFAIQDSDSGACLFLGRVTDPR